MQIEQIGFATVSLLLATLIAAGPKGISAKFAILSIILTVMFLGPRIFGRDWFSDGYVAGVLLGSFAGEIFSSVEPSSGK